MKLPFNISKLKRINCYNVGTTINYHDMYSAYSSNHLNLIVKLYKLGYIFNKIHLKICIINKNLDIVKWTCSTKPYLIDIHIFRLTHDNTFIKILYNYYVKCGSYDLLLFDSVYNNIRTDSLFEISELSTIIKNANIKSLPNPLNNKVNFIF